MGDSIACHRCGQMLDSEAAFCAHCGAPQIRVPTSEPEIAEAAAPTQVAAHTRGIDWSRAFLAVFLPAVIASATLELPFLGYGVLLWVAAAGFISVRMYRRRAQSAWIDSGVGAKLGAAVGVLSSLFAIVLSSLDLVRMSASGQSVRDAVLQQLRTTAAQNPNANTQAFIDQLAKNPQMVVGLVAAGMALMGLIFIVCGTIGGAIAGSTEARRPRPR